MAAVVGTTAVVVASGTDVVVSIIFGVVSTRAKSENDEISMNIYYVLIDYWHRYTYYVLSVGQQSKCDFNDVIHFHATQVVRHADLKYS